MYLEESLMLEKTRQLRAALELPEELTQRCAMSKWPLWAVLTPGEPTRLEEPRP